MNAEQQKALRAHFDPSEVGKLPRVTCKACRDSSQKVCGNHSKSKCSVCGNYGTNAHIHLDFVGHAELTDRLLDVDPEWSWEPAAWSDAGEPVISRHGSNLVMWGRLTLCGTTRLGVGTAPANKDDAHKELIGDFLRNAAMRFGVALDLWRKSEKAEREHDDDRNLESAPANPSSDPCPKCGEVVEGAGREPMRAHLVAEHGFTRQDDGTVVAPKIEGSAGDAATEPVEPSEDPMTAPFDLEGAPA